MHERDGYINPTAWHGRIAPCSCEAPVNPPADMPAECQAELLEHDWCTQWASLPRQGAGTRKSRYEAYRCWAKGLGIKGTRVDMPPCVKALIAAEFGASQPGFNPGVNNCMCETCVNVAQEAEAEAFDQEAAHDATAGDGGGGDDAGGLGPENSGNM